MQSLLIHFTNQTGAAKTAPTSSLRTHSLHFRRLFVWVVICFFNIFFSETISSSVFKYNYATIVGSSKLLKTKKNHSVSSAFISRRKIKVSFYSNYSLI